MIKITDFLIGIVLVGFVLFGIFSLVQSTNNFMEIDGFSESTMQNKINFTKNITTDVNKAKSDVEKLSATPSLFDIVGFFTNSVWGSVKGVFNSFVIFNQFVDASTQDAGGFGNGFIELKNVIILIITISLFIGFSVYLLIGRTP